MSPRTPLNRMHNNSEVLRVIFKQKFTFHGSIDGNTGIISDIFMEGKYSFHRKSSDIVHFIIYLLILFYLVKADKWFIHRF